MRRIRIITVSLLLTTVAILALAQAEPISQFITGLGRSVQQADQESNVQDAQPNQSPPVEETGEAPTLSTDKTEYIVDETVFFSGTGYAPDGEYYVIVIKFNGEVKGTVRFVSTSEASDSDEDSTPLGSIPPETSWRIPFDAEGGTYVAEVFEAAEHSEEKVDGTPLASVEFQVDDSMEARAEAIRRELEALNEAVEADVEGIEVSLTQKISVVSKKIEQFTKWVEEDKENTAANMLNAAMNNLKALIHHVEAQKGKHIGEETADQLIAQVQELIEKMETTISDLDTRGKGKQVSTQTRIREREMKTEREMEREMEIEREGKGQGNSNGKGKAKGKDK
ncbi:MAG: hypothetical protein N3F08_01030 [Crenarchaeota archaeon]|nr:hypothetical protein [Thermoproteota archaeon]